MISTITATFIAFSGVSNGNDDPAICWSKRKLSQELQCWCALKREFHSGPPGTPGWNIKPQTR